MSKNKSPANNLSKEEQQELEEARLWAQFSKSRPWRVAVKPFLESKFRNSWPDPRDYKDDKEFLFAYAIMRGWAEAGREFFQKVDEMVAKFEYLTKKSKGELKKPFRIGGDN